MTSEQIHIGNMSHETAIGILKLMLEAMETYDGISPTPARINAIKMAIKALEQEPTTKNDLGVDWESYKDADGNSLDYLILNVLQNNFDCGDAYGYTVADKIISLLPSVTPQDPKTGHWEYGYAFPDGQYCRCSECEELIKCIYPMHYCSNCGAKMQSEAE